MTEGYEEGERAYLVQKAELAEARAARSEAAAANFRTEAAGIIAAMDQLQMRWAAVRSLVAEQTEDKGLWFVARTAAEGYLQQELRRLHSAVEEGV